VVGSQAVLAWRCRCRVIFGESFQILNSGTSACFACSQKFGLARISVSSLFCVSCAASDLVCVFVLRQRRLGFPSYTWSSCKPLGCASLTGMFRARSLRLVLLLAMVLARCGDAAADYAEVRVRVQRSYAAKAHELLETLGALQQLSRDTASLLSEVEARCGSVAQ